MMIAFGWGGFPVLGPALPGDLGPVELRARKSLGLNANGATSENDKARAEELRLAQLSRQANEGGGVFRIKFWAAGFGAAIARAITPSEVWSQNQYPQVHAPPSGACDSRSIPSADRAPSR